MKKNLVKTGPNTRNISMVLYVCTLQKKKRKRNKYKCIHMYNSYLRRACRRGHSDSRLLYCSTIAVPLRLLLFVDILSFILA